jgi:N-acyl-D-amino-acid deacylase
MIEQARKEKVWLTCDFFPYTRTGSNLYMLLPDWVRESGKEHILKLIRGEERKSILEFLKELTLHYEKITIASTLQELDIIGKSVLELSQSSGISPEETILNLLEINDLQVGIFNEAILENNIELLAKRDYGAVSSDGVGYAGDYRSKTDLPHPRSFGTFPRFFSRFVKEKNALSWENAVYKMTGFPARILGLKDRGFVAPGAYADLVIVDPETIADRADYINPYQFPTGIDSVLINGIVALKDNSLTGLARGRVLRHS